MSLAGVCSCRAFFCFGGIMPETKFESVVFTAVTAFLMVYIMTLYNTVLASGQFVNLTFLISLKSMWFEFVIIGLCAFFISSPLAKHFAFKIGRGTDRFLLFLQSRFLLLFFRLPLQVYLAFGTATVLQKILFQIT